MEDQTLPFVLEQVIAAAGLIGAVATLPVLLEFLFERAKRRERIALSLEILPVNALRGTLAGCDDLLHSIADLIDRARHPEIYRDQRAGNEILIIGPALVGKKALAQRIACEAQMDTLLIVHNPRNADALAKAKQLVQRSGATKLMLLLPRLDLIDPHEDEELLTELDALIETATARPNILVIGTTRHYTTGNEIDNLFGIALAMPGTRLSVPPPLPQRPDMYALLQAVAAHYLQNAQQNGYQLHEISAAAFIARMLRSAANPAQIEDILVLCQTLALYRQRSKAASHRLITPDILETVLRRVIIEEDRNLWDQPPTP